jgi:hypothetical protein
MADEGFELVVCGRDFGEAPELFELSNLLVLTKREIEVLRQVSREVLELQKQTDKVFTTFNKPDGTIVSYFRPAKPASFVNINTTTNSVKTDNTEEAEQSEI